MGQPAGFDRVQALQRAMEVFWTREFEGAALEGMTQLIPGGAQFLNSFLSHQSSRSTDCRRVSDRGVTLRRRGLFSDIGTWFKRTTLPFSKI
jgi:hypothetical protein